MNIDNIFDALQKSLLEGVTDQNKRDATVDKLREIKAKFTALTPQQLTYDTLKQFVESAFDGLSDVIGDNLHGNHDLIIDVVYGAIAPAYDGLFDESMNLDPGDPKRKDLRAMALILGDILSELTALKLRLHDDRLKEAAGKIKENLRDLETFKKQIDAFLKGLDTAKEIAQYIMAGLGILAKILPFIL